MPACDQLLLNANTIDKNGLQINDVAIAIRENQIIWHGLSQDVPDEIKVSAKKIEKCNGRLLTPGLIDCHTHLVYAGNRAEEFKERLNGISYSEIAKRGGGILSTVKQTRMASEDMLIEQSLPRLLAMRAEGVLTVEIKSGYGLDLDTELKMLRVAKKLGALTGVRVVNTFLGAHALPPEYKGKQADYIRYVVEDMLPRVAEEKLADAVDVFCETIGFTLDETEQVFQKAKALGLPVKVHAEQLSNMGATSLAARYQALSSDHIEYIDANDIEAMKKSDMVAVLLPGAFYFLRETKKPPIELFRAAGIGMAIATDCNPGSSPTTSLRLMLNMACQFFALTVSEAISGITYQAARALGLASELGVIEASMSANILKWPVQDVSELCYTFGSPIYPELYQAGVWKPLNTEIN